MYTRTAAARDFTAHKRGGGGGGKKIYIKNGAACSGAKGRRNQWRHGDWSPPNFGLYVHPFLDRSSTSCQCSFGPIKIFDIPVPLQLRKFAFVHATQRRRIVRSNICSLLMHKSKGTKHLFHFLPINVHNCWSNIEQRETLLSTVEISSYVSNGLSYS